MPRFNKQSSRSPRNAVCMHSWPSDKEEGHKKALKRRCFNEEGKVQRWWAWWWWGQKEGLGSEMFIYWTASDAKVQVISICASSRSTMEIY